MPFGKRQLLGVIWDLGSSTAPEALTLKPLLEHFPLCLPESTCLFMQRVADYILAPLGSLLKMVLGVNAEAALSNSAHKPSAPSFHTPSPVTLSSQQQKAAQQIQELCHAQQFAPILLEGLTGSGKTEVYFEQIARTLEEEKKQILLLLPEIALTTQLIRRFESRFGFTPSLWHADITPKNRKQTWCAILNGEARVVIGARSALFLPYQNLGLIIVDEEHDSSYKQEEGSVRYHARDMAVLRGSLDGIPVLLTSATPSLETQWNVNKGRYAHIKLDRRFQATLPALSLIPFKKTATLPHFISPLLREKLIQTFAQKEQSLLFLNRRGYAPFVSCKTCNEVIACPDCQIGFVFHQTTNGLLCHYCGKTQALHTPCVACASQDQIVLKGPGVEKIAEEVISFLPEARVHLMSSDHMTSPRKLDTLIRALETREIDILIGTQMVAKGHHFPNLTCVGILDGDAGASSLDFRAPERLLQLLTQVSGRAGRAHIPGHVYIQTQDPDAPLLQTFLNQTHATWFAQEMESRLQHCWPPQARLAALIVSSPCVKKGQTYAQALGRAYPNHPHIRVLGPIPAPLFKIRRHYRWRFLIRGPRHLLLQPFLKAWIQACPPPSLVRLTPDIDPYQFL